MTDSTWEQPGFEDALEGTAVNLITGFVQRIFADLDPLELVRAEAPELSEDDQRAVAHLIDEAVVELEVDVSGHDH
ncbi:hypothetical protein [Propionicimonas sp.]|uniref:hypothetical protein n=1 Tax=Propionicimonas sp. TaxID=1955623 RepID=UPI0039E555C0